MDYNRGNSGAGRGRGRGGGSGGRAGRPGGDDGRDRGRVGNYPNQPGGRGGRGGNYPNQLGGRGGGERTPQPVQHSSIGYRPVQEHVAAPRPLPTAQSVGRGSWARPLAWAQSPAAGASQTARPVTPTTTWPPNPGHRPDGDGSPAERDLSNDFQSLKIPEKQAPSLDVQGSIVNRKLPIRRPDRGGTEASRRVWLLANHFFINYNPANTILHYDIAIKAEILPGGRFVKKAIPKSDLRDIREKLFSDDPTRFPLLDMTAYDGEKNIFSAVKLPTGTFKVKLLDGEKSRSYDITIQFVNELRLSKLREYLGGNLLDIPRDVLQGMDLVMKEYSSRHMISVGRGLFSKEFRPEDDLHCGLAAFKGFQQGLKPTSQGPSLCLDYQVLAFRKRMPVLDFLREHIPDFREVRDVQRLRREVTAALKGVKVNVTHRRTKQKYIVAGLTDKDTRHLTFSLQDPEGRHEPREVTLVDYFLEKYGRKIVHLDIPCLVVGKTNYIPMEFCILAEDRRYPKEKLSLSAQRQLRDRSVVSPNERKRMISEMVQAEYGGEVIQNFGLEVDMNMTRLQSRVIQAPRLKLRTLSGQVSTINVDRTKCHWNLLEKSVVEGRPVERWALIDFSAAERERKYRFDGRSFIPKLMDRYKNLKVRMDEPLVVRPSNMRVLTNVSELRRLFDCVVKEAGRISKGRLQLIVCVMARKDDGYKNIKWVSENQIGVMTQCCLADLANFANDQYLANLFLKMNAKLGGSNVELIERLPHFKGEEHVMFIGADVNHPAALNATCPSIAAVVATVNWPAVSRYAARVCPQEHRKERILNFGSMCADLVNTYARLNNVKPKRIVIFRDGVSTGQYDMVLNEELVDIKSSIYDEHYQPTITLVVAQKRHLTRLFLENERDGIRPGNMPPGTVVDTTITHPFEFDFYLCSHFGGLGTSKSTHYAVLWDEHGFTSDEMQKLVYNLCFTFARCTKPVSLVPPVYYADLVAYRGRMYQEVVIAQQSPASASSSSSSITSSSFSSAVSFDESFYRLHPDLQNNMFFI